MAASQNPLQGSLFEGKDESNHLEFEQELSLKASEHNLSIEQLENDASLRPRTKNRNKNKKQIQIDDIDKGLAIDSDEPKWSHHSLPSKEDLTPALRHYVELKASDPTRVLLYRLGDFFECFFEDAIKLSKILEITLTSKEGGKKIGRVPMAGIPHHASERYCIELIKKGLSIAICDQLESAPQKVIN